MLRFCVGLLMGDMMIVSLLLCALLRRCACLLLRFFVLLNDRKATRSLAKYFARLAEVSKVSNKKAAKFFLAMICRLNC